MSETANDTLTDLLKKVTDDSGGVPILQEGDEVIELGEEFDFEGFQVVRREFFAHLREPSCNFNNCKFSVTPAALQRVPNSE